MKTIQSYSKINLGLYITGRRDDGYHNLHSIFIETDLSDTIKYEIIKEKIINFDTNHVKLKSEKSNTVIKVIESINELIPFGIKLFLDKKIPDQAGLGAGSANAAYILKELNKTIKLNLSINDMLPIANKIGADVPFFLNGGIAEVKGIGEIINPLKIPFPYFIVILKHNKLAFSTKEIFSKLKLNSFNNNPRSEILEYIDKPSKETLIELTNNLELPVNEISPKIKEMKNILINNGAFYASMTGSGSAVYGLFDEKPELSLKNQDLQIFYTKARYGNNTN